MPDESLSLDQLHDIVPAEPVPLWPLANAFWLLLALASLAALTFALRRWLIWRQTAYQRAALAELETAHKATEVSSILKRAAMQVFPRTEVASLTGKVWYDWLTQFTNGSDALQREFDSCLSGAPKDCSQELNDFATRCIRSMPLKSAVPIRSTESQQSTARPTLAKPS